MPPDLAPAVAPVVPAAVVLPPAEQPPAPTAPKSFDERWKAIESKVGATEETEEGAPVAPAAREPVKSEKKPELDPKETKKAQLKALATELGLVFDESGISTQEAIEVRAAKRRNLEWKAQREAEFAQKEQEFSATHGEKLKKSARLQQRAEQEDARKEAEKKETETRAQTEHRQKVYAGYMSTLTETCKASSNPLVAAMADDPLFLRSIYSIQEENWDDDTQRTVTVEEAIKKAVKGGSASLEDSLRQLHERLGKGFAVVGQTAPPAAAKTNGKKPAPKTAVVPSNSSGGTSAPKKPGDMSPSEWRKHFNARMREASDD